MEYSFKGADIHVISFSEGRDCIVSIETSRGESISVNPDDAGLIRDALTDELSAIKEAEKDAFAREKIIVAACLSYRHDYGLLSEEEAKAIRAEAERWFDAWDFVFSSDQEEGEQR